MYNTAASEEGEYNLKFICRECHYEAVYNKDGILLTQYNDPDNMATFNYANHKVNPIGHFSSDVVPYYEWGNVEGKECPDDDSAKERYYSNREAQRHRGKIEAIMENREIYEGAYQVTGNFNYPVIASSLEGDTIKPSLDGSGWEDNYRISQGTILVLDYAGVCTQGVDSVTGKSYVNFDFLPYIGSNLIKMY